MAKPVYNPGQMTEKPIEHYTRIFTSLEPAGISSRTAVPYDAERGEFTLTLMGAEYAVSWPDATIEPKDSSDPLAFPINPYERILMLRYLDEGKYIEPIDKYIAYNELPWGDVYGSNFQGRVISRFLREFGRDTDAFKRIMETVPSLAAVPEPKCDVGYCFRFMNGLMMKVLMWEGDDEFPPAAQMLYDETIVFGYTAEDVAVAGDILIARMKRFRELLPPVV
ncbi:MAG: DUF3786 domain-containing protein [Clostridiales Family XIII bacterium]|jgi:hypothetical protein|nr:DUF3786 domain-containing protein [Clostridiales Family XIII bacterium]